MALTFSVRRFSLDEPHVWGLKFYPKLKISLFCLFCPNWKCVNSCTHTNITFGSGSRPQDSERAGTFHSTPQPPQLGRSFPCPGLPACLGNDLFYRTCKCKNAGSAWSIRSRVPGTSSLLCPLQVAAPARGFAAQDRRDRRDFSRKGIWVAFLIGLNRKKKIQATIGFVLISGLRLIIEQNLK